MSLEEDCKDRSRAVADEMMALIRDFLESEDRRGTPCDVSSPAIVAALSCVMTDLIDRTTEDLTQAMSCIDAISTTAHALMTVRKDMVKR